jgi:hypothetical protein
MKDNLGAVDKAIRIVLMFTSLLALNFLVEKLRFFDMAELITLLAGFIYFTSLGKLMKLKDMIQKFKGSESHLLQEHLL